MFMAHFNMLACLACKNDTTYGQAISAHHANKTVRLKGNMLRSKDRIRGVADWRGATRTETLNEPHSVVFGGLSIVCDDRQFALCCAICFCSCFEMLGSCSEDIYVVQHTRIAPFYLRVYAIHDRCSCQGRYVTNER